VRWNIRDEIGRFCDVGSPRAARVGPLPPEPIPHFSKQDLRNLTAARARLAELLFKEKREQSLVTPPEELPSWKWSNPRRRTFDRCLTHELLGDPGRERSALGGWEQRGSEWTINGRVVESMARAEPSMPSASSIQWIVDQPLSGAAMAVLALRRDGCRFPIGNVRSADFHFCGAPRSGSSSYCARHAAECAERGR
jgi:GcrA cell cycle regulator